MWLLVITLNLCSFESTYAAYAGITPKPADGTATPPATNATPTPGSATTPAATQFLTASPSAVFVGDVITVRWNTTNFFDPRDLIIMVNRSAGGEFAEGKQVLLRGGDTLFVASRVGANEFRYFRSNGELVMVSGPVLVLERGTPVVRTVATARDEVTLSWFAEGGGRYRVLSNTNLMDASGWKLAVGVTPEKTGMLTVSVPKRFTEEFFKVVRDMPPLAASGP